LESLARHIRRLAANKDGADKTRARASEEDEGSTRASGGGLARDSMLLGESATRARL
ncbi:unnamed protein product, partial [Ectocarpus fasciculatus]